MGWMDLMTVFNVRNRFGVLNINVGKYCIKIKNTKKVDMSYVERRGLVKFKRLGRYIVRVETY